MFVNMAVFTSCRKITRRLLPQPSCKRAHLTQMVACLTVNQIVGSSSLPVSVPERESEETGRFVG